MGQTSVILIAYHADKWLPGCIESLQEASTSRLHLVLVDNSGNTLLESLNYDGFDLELLQTPYPMGFSEANNFALTQSKQPKEYLLFLNQDTISPRGWIDQCEALLESHPLMGALSPSIRNYDDSGWDPSFLTCLPGTADSMEDITYVENAPAAALFVRKAVLQKTGPFDPIFGSYYEDYDLCRRIRKEGFKIAFSKKARLQHFSGSTTDSAEKVLRRTRLIIRNRFIHQIRQAQKPYLLFWIEYLLLDWPTRMLRSLLKTPSSQPLTAVVGALKDILRLFPRLKSSKIDFQIWKNYLNQINWRNF